MTEEESSAEADFSSFIQKNIKNVAESIKLSSTLPIGFTRTNFLTCFPSFTDEIEPYSYQLLNLMSILLRKEGIKANIKNCDSEEKVDLIVDAVNKILSRVKDNLNKLNGIKCNPITNELEIKKNISGSWNKNLNKSVRWKSNFSETLTKSITIQKVLEKPQNKFKKKIDNSNLPFEPLLQNKPNAIKPLAIYIEISPDGVERYCHPYSHELNCFKIPQCQLKKVEPCLSSEIDSSCAIYVDNEEALSDMINNLKNEKELAVDLEHHNYRSYQGLTCLMQISTRKIDYIIDTLALRSTLNVLNEIFTDPNIVKVFHDATSDIIWLQKDLNLYVVNLFDTYVASLTLNFPRLSLAYLLKQYCNVEPDKRYQLYDWRIRPLSKSALAYARTDTHYLLYVYDKLRNALIEKVDGATNLLESVYFRGVDLCKKRYDKQTDNSDYLRLYKQSKQSFDNRQLEALKSLYLWRDKVARDEDESTQFVLPNHMLLQIAEILPREMQGILACCNPVPTLVRRNLSHLQQLILSARNQPTNKLETTIQNDTYSLISNKTPALSKLRCPHDFSHHDDFRDNLTTLLDGSDLIVPINFETKLQLSVFENNEKSSSFDEKSIQPTNVKFITPYERYKKTISFIIAQDEKENTKKDLLTKDDINKDCVYIKKVKKQEKESVEEETSEKVETSEVTSKTVSDNDSTITVETQNVVISSGTKRRIETLIDQIANKKFAKDYDAVLKVVKASSGLSYVEPSKLPIEDENVNLKLVDEKKAVSLDGSSNIIKSKKKKKKKKPKFNNRNKLKTNNFTPFDYTKVNYNKFISSGPKNLKKLLNAKITFGANKKNKNKFKKQNRK